MVTGRLKGNWQASDDKPVTTATLTTDKDGDSTIKKMEENISPIGVSYLTNNLSYAGKIEEKYGMVTKNIARINRNLRGLVRGKN